VTLSWLASFTGLAALYALLTTAVGLTLARRVGWVNNWRSAPFWLSTFFFIFLTQHPFPDPLRLDCPVDSATPQLRPFLFWTSIVTLHQTGAGVTEWLGNKTIMATTMNFAVCAVIGATLARHTSHILRAAMFGAVLTISVEMTQLTGLWRLYPCAYRQFNVDDLLLNFLGVVAGFSLLRAIWFKEPGTDQRTDSAPSP
jgi:hypothetical protein